MFPKTHSVYGDTKVYLVKNTTGHTWRREWNLLQALQGEHYRVSW